MEGYLERKLGGRLLSKWQKRFYRVNDNVLECYQDDSCSLLKGKLQLQGVPSIMTSPNDPRLVIIRLAPSNQTVLELAMRDGDCFEMRAPDVVAAARWVAAIVPFVSVSRHGVGQGPPRPGSTRQLLPASTSASSERRLSQEDHRLTHDGFLWKRAIHSGRNWKRRFFTLHGDVLRYSKEPGASTLGTLMLTADCAVDRAVEGESETQYAFRVLLAEHDGGTDVGNADTSVESVGSGIANPAAAAAPEAGSTAQAAAATALAAANTGIRGGIRLVPIFLAAESSPQLEAWIESLRAALGALVEERAAAQVRRGQTGRLSQADKEMAEVRAAQRQARAESNAQQQARAPTIAGYGLKRAIGSGRNWKRRYFVLRGHALSYFNDEYDAARAAGASLCGDDTNSSTVDTRWGEGAKGMVHLRQGCSTVSGKELLRRLVKAAGQRTQARRDGTREGACAQEPCAADADAHMALWEARGGSSGNVPSILELQNAKLDDSTDALDTVLVIIEPKFDETSDGSNSLVSSCGSTSENTCDVLSFSQRAIYLRFDSLVEREKWQNALECAVSFPSVNSDADNDASVYISPQTSSVAAPPLPPEQAPGPVQAVPVDWVVDVRDSELSSEWTMMQATAFVPAAGFEDGLPRLRLTRMDEAAQTELVEADGLEVALEPTYRRLRLVECCNAPASVNQGDADFGGALYRRLLRKAQVSTAWKVRVYADDSGSWRAGRVQSYNRATNMLSVYWYDAPQTCHELAFDEMVQFIECLDSDSPQASELFQHLRTESEATRAAMGIHLEEVGRAKGAEECSMQYAKPAQGTKAVPVDWVVDVRDSELSPEWTMMQATAFVPAAGFEDGLPRLRLTRMDEAAQTELVEADGLEVALEPTYRRLRLVECCSGGVDDFGRVLFTRITGKAEISTAWKVHIYADDIERWRPGQVESYNRATSVLRVRWDDAPDELNEHVFDEMVVLDECIDAPLASQSGSENTNVSGHCSFELFHVLRDEAEAARAALGVQIPVIRSEQCSPISQRSPTATGLGDTALHVQMAEARRRASLSIDELVALQEQELHAAIENAASMQQNTPCLGPGCTTAQLQEDCNNVITPPSQEDQDRNNHVAMQTQVNGVTCVEL